MTEALRYFPGDLDEVFTKLSVKRKDVVNVYLIGSRMWGTATHTSDYDIYVVTKGATEARNSHFRLPPGLEVDAVVVGASYFQQRLDFGKLKELSCIWAPEACQLLCTRTFAPASGKVDPKALSSSLAEGYAKDWTRARKLIEGGNLVAGKKVILHCVRAHLLAVEIVEQGKIVDYETAADVVEWLHGVYSKQWQTYVDEFAGRLADMRVTISGNHSKVEAAGTPGEVTTSLTSMSISKSATDAILLGERNTTQGQGLYWFGDASVSTEDDAVHALGSRQIMIRQVSLDADELAVAEVVKELEEATKDAIVSFRLQTVNVAGSGSGGGGRSSSEDGGSKESRRLVPGAPDSKKHAFNNMRSVIALALDRGLSESHNAVVVARGVLKQITDTADEVKQRAAESRSNEVSITNYPSTPHLPFSPTVHSDDIQMSTVAPALLAEEIIVTEKLDGGNCCLYNGEVFARTHSAPTTNAWFSRTKQKLSSFSWVKCLRPLKIFGENMEAIHSIAYGVPVSSLFLFGVYDPTHGGFFWPWDSMAALAHVLGLPTAQIVFRGFLGRPKDIKNLMDSEMKKPTAVQRGAPEFPDLSEHQHVFPEGFVIRVTRGFPGSGFETAIGKYVRAGHVQTKEDWRRTWQPSVDRVTGGGSGVGNGESGGGENTTTQPPLISRLQHIGDLEARCQTIIRITRRMYFEWLDQRTAR